MPALPLTPDPEGRDPVYSFSSLTPSPSTMSGSLVMAKTLAPPFTLFPARPGKVYAQRGVVMRAVRSAGREGEKVVRAELGEVISEPTEVLVY